MPGGSSGDNGSPTHRRLSHLPGSQQVQRGEGFRCLAQYHAGKRSGYAQVASHQLSTGIDEQRALPLGRMADSNAGTAVAQPIAKGETSAGVVADLGAQPGTAGYLQYALRGKGCR